jgi:hypothetical protein
VGRWGIGLENVQTVFVLCVIKRVTGRRSAQRKKNGSISLIHVQPSQTVHHQTHLPSLDLAGKAARADTLDCIIGQSNRTSPL